MSATTDNRNGEDKIGPPLPNGLKQEDIVSKTEVIKEEKTRYNPVWFIIGALLSVAALLTVLFTVFLPKDTSSSVDDDQDKLNENADKLIAEEQKAQKLTEEYHKAVEAKINTIDKDHVVRLDLLPESIKGDVSSGVLKEHEGATYVDLSEVIKADLNDNHNLDINYAALEVEHRNLVVNDINIGGGTNSISDITIADSNTLHATLSSIDAISDQYTKDINACHKMEAIYAAEIVNYYQNIFANGSESDIVTATATLDNERNINASGTKTASAYELISDTNAHTGSTMTLNGRTFFNNYSADYFDDIHSSQYGMHVEKIGDPVVQLQSFIDNGYWNNIDSLKEARDKFAAARKTYVGDLNSSSLDLGLTAKYFSVTSNNVLNQFSKNNAVNLNNVYIDDNGTKVSFNDYAAKHVDTIQDLGSSTVFYVKSNSSTSAAPSYDVIPQDSTFDKVIDSHLKEVQGHAHNFVTTQNSENILLAKVNDFIATENTKYADLSKHISTSLFEKQIEEVKDNFTKNFIGKTGAGSAGTTASTDQMLGDKTTNVSYVNKGAKIQTYSTYPVTTEVKDVCLRDKSNVKVPVYNYDVASQQWVTYAAA